MTLLTDLGGALIYFTLLLPIWEQRPLTDEDIVPGPYPLEVPDEQIVFAVRGFDYADEALLRQMVQTFGKSQSPAASEALLNLIREDGGNAAVATALLQLGNLPLENPRLATEIARYLKHDDWRVRFWAADTYSRLPAGKPDLLLSVAAEDTSGRVGPSVLELIAANKHNIRFEQFARFIDSQDRRLRISAVKAALAAPDVDGHRGEILAAAKDNDPAIRHAVISSILHMPDNLGLELAEIGSRDKHPSVRAEVARQLADIRSGKARDLLITLCGDSDFDVRRSACDSLASFPETAAVSVLCKLLGDGHQFVRQSAEDSLVTIHPTSPVDEITTAAIASPSSEARFHSYNVLGRIGVEARREAIAAAVGAETVPDNIAAALLALNRLNYSTSDSVILAYVDHEDSMVREAAAGALGNVGTAAGEKALIRMADDEDLEVVSTVIVSMGRLGKPVFAPTFLKILKDTGITARYSARHRAQVCWAAGRLASLDSALEKRLVVQGTTPVIRTPMGNLFESDPVLVSVDFALAQQARRDPGIRKSFEKVHAMHSHRFTLEEQRRAGENTLVPSEELIEYSRQALAYLEGRSIKPAPRPTRTMQFLYKAVKKR